MYWGEGEERDLLGKYLVLLVCIYIVISYI